MLKASLAKSKMVNEEGTNHLWVQIDTSFPINIEVRLPKGVNRKPNLNGYPEDDHGTIRVKNSEQNDLLIELFTEPSAMATEGTIVITASKESNQSKTYIKAIPLKIASPDDIGDIFLDHLVINRLKSFQGGN